MSSPLTILNDNSSADQGRALFGSAPMPNRLKSMPEFDDTPEFYALLSEAVKKDPYAILNISEKYITYDLLRIALTEDPMLTNQAEAFLFDAFHKLMDESLVSEIIIKNLAAAAPYPAGSPYGYSAIDSTLITDQAMKQALMNKPYYAGIAVHHEKGYLIKELVSEGFWPKEDWIKNKPISSTSIKALASDKEGLALHGPAPWYDALQEVTPKKTKKHNDLSLKF